MFPHQHPTPPRWEAIEEPDSSQDESASDDDDEARALDRTHKADKRHQVRKRKDNDGPSARTSPVKRPRHEEAGRAAGKNAMRPPITTSTSAPGGSRQTHPTSTQAGPSRLSNATSNATSISAGPRSQPPTSVGSSGLSKMLDSDKHTSKAPRSRYQRLSIFSNESDKGSGGTLATKKTSQRRDFPISLPDKVASSSNTKPSQFQKPGMGDNEIIEISSDDSEPAPPRSKPSSSKPSVPNSKPQSGSVARARKSTGGGPKPKNKPSPEIVVITDSDGEPPPPSSRLFELMKDCAPKKQTTGITPNPRHELTNPESDDSMEGNYGMDAASLASPDMEIEQAEVVQAAQTSPIASSPARTNTSISSKIEPHSPPIPRHESPFPKPSPTNKSPAKKPVFNRHGINDIPSPSSEKLMAPQRPKHNAQSAVKSASAAKRSRSSSSPGDKSSDSPKANSSSQESEDKSPHNDIDMRNLSDALDVAVPTSRLPAPAATSPAVESAVAPLSRRASVVEPPRANFKTNMAKSNVVRNSSGSGNLSLADAINSIGQANVPRRRKEPQQRIPLPSANEGISPEQAKLQEAKESSLRFANMLASRKGKGKASEPSPIVSPAVPLDLRPTSSQSSGLGIGQPLIAPVLPSPPPASPSPRLEDTSAPGIQRSKPPSETTFDTAFELERRPRSAPSLGEENPLHSKSESHIRPSGSASQSPSILAVAKGPEVLRKHIRPLSLTSLPPKPQSFSPRYVPATPSPLHSPKPSISEARPKPSEATARSSSPKAQGSPQSPNTSRSPQHVPASPQAVSPQPQGIKSPSPRHLQQTSLDDPLTQMLGGNIAAPSSVAIEQEQPAMQEIVTESASEDVDDDVNMLFGPSTSSPSETSDDEAMKEAAEVEALFEDDAISMDVDEANDSKPEPEPDPVVSSSITSMTRRSSRMSSRSSVSEHWPATPEDEHELLVFDADKNPEGTVVVKPLKTYGGFRAITMKDHVAEQKTLLQRCRYARDLPHIFHDYVNDMPQYLRSMPAMRSVFEAVILENTVNDEPDAPKIEVQNDVDDEATPPWEFYYSNEMWLGEGVPHPDIENLVRCTCKGACNPKSKTCACLKRQREACQDPNLEFAYDKTGKLKIPGYPIFECNDLCGCGDECRNRVVQHGRKVAVAIRKTAVKGWGVFATKKILAGSFIGIYSGELITDVAAHERGINYNKFGRTYLFDIDFHHLKDDDSDWTNKFTVDAYHAGNFTRFLNHSCDPNCRLFACYINEGSIDKPLLVIFSLRDIDANEEICFNYQGNYPGDDEESKDGEEEEENGDRSSSVLPETRDRIYEQCMCGAKNCTGVMFK